jgi:hypothetical protein
VATREVNLHPEIGLDVAVVEEGGALVLNAFAITFEGRIVPSTTN